MGKPLLTPKTMQPLSIEALLAVCLILPSLKNFVVSVIGHGIQIIMVQAVTL